MKLVRKLAVCALLLNLFACSLPPQRPITIDELMRTKVFAQYGIEESPEDVLAALNRDGEVVVHGAIKVMGKDYPVYVKILATSEGLDTSHYDR